MSHECEPDGCELVDDAPGLTVGDVEKRADGTELVQVPHRRHDHDEASAWTENPGELARMAWGEDVQHYVGYTVAEGERLPHAEHEASRSRDVAGGHADCDGGAVGGKEG